MASVPRYNSSTPRRTTAASATGPINEEWRQFTFTGIVNGGVTLGTNFLIFLNTLGDVYLDDLVLSPERALASARTSWPTVALNRP